MYLLLCPKYLKSLIYCKKLPFKLNYGNDRQMCVRPVPAELFLQLTDLREANISLLNISDDNMAVRDQEC